MLSFLVILELLVCKTNLPSCKQSSWICFGTCCHFDTGNVLQAANPTGRMTLNSAVVLKSDRAPLAAPPNIKGAKGHFSHTLLEAPPGKAKVIRVVGRGPMSKVVANFCGGVQQPMQLVMLLQEQHHLTICHLLQSRTDLDNVSAG